ncbi:hypothetical protein TNCV_1211881 [Trichonephila clavipes]|nr:hypothetical protein TNCV_1211881 [Trichonephila clavipes]
MIRDGRLSCRSLTLNGSIGLWYPERCCGLLSRNPVDNVKGSQISCAVLRALTLNSREQLIQEQREDPELWHIYYLENPEDGVQLMELYARVDPTILS